MVKNGARAYHFGFTRFIVLSIGAAWALGGCTRSVVNSGVSGGSTGYADAAEGAPSGESLVNGGQGGTEIAAGSGSGSIGVAGSAGGNIAAGVGGGEAGGKGGQAGTVASTNCKSLPKLPITKYTKIPVSGSEDFTFDNLGYIIGVDSAENTLIRTKYDLTEETIIPNIGSAEGAFPVRGLRFSAGANSNTGELVFADVGGSGLTKINMGTKERTSLTSGVNQPNGLALGQNGFAYLTGADGNVLRVNIKTGESSTFFAQAVENVSLDGIAFSPDFKRLYIDTEFGYLSYLPVKSDGTAGDYVIMAEFPQEEQDPNSEMPPMPAMLDGMTVDECGNVYVVQMNGIVWRVSPDSLMEKPKMEKVVTIVREPTDGGTAGTGGDVPFGPPGGPGGPGGLSLNAANFGSGVGGWRSDAIYIISMNGGVYEVVVGVKGAKQPHLM
jgi:hypothetical protein